MKSILFMLLPTLLLIVGCTGETLSGVDVDESGVAAEIDGVAAKQGVKMVPFKAEAVGRAVEQGPHPDCPGATVIRTIGEGTGHSTLLGYFTWTSSHCTDFSTLTFYNGRLTSIAANGDELYTEYEGVLTGPVSWIELDTIVGGTGRFANATGWANDAGAIVETPDGPIWEIRYDGEISSVGSVK